MELSSLHMEVLKFISEIYDGAVENNFTFKSNNTEDLVLDIYIPEKNFAIEINNLYNPSELIVKDKRYNFNISKNCRDNGIRLVHIWEHEWASEKQLPILKSIIKSALGMNKKIYARKLDVVYRSSKSMRNFFDTNNIQGFRGGEYAICLVDKTGEIIMAYLIGRGNHMSKGYQYEVIRGASILGYNITGGTSKLFSHLFKDKPDIVQIVYYIDYNYFDGISLKNNDTWEFKSEQVSFKNYHVNTKQVKNREPSKHAEITRGYADGSIIPLWNAGTASYIYSR